MRAMIIETIIPTEEDFERVENFSFRKNSFFGNGAPFQSEATKMAKLIKDPEKLVRRAKATASRWGTQTVNGYSNSEPQPQNVWEPFATALEKMGFSGMEIETISNYKK